MTNTTERVWITPRVSKSVQLLETVFLHIDVTSVNPISGDGSCASVNHALQH